jgi:hypothetical protein
MLFAAWADMADSLRLVPLLLERLCVPDVSCGKVTQLQPTPEEQPATTMAMHIKLALQGIGHQLKQPPDSRGCELVHDLQRVCAYLRCQPEAVLVACECVVPEVSLHSFNIIFAPYIIVADCRILFACREPW